MRWNSIHMLENDQIRNLLVNWIIIFNHAVEPQSVQKTICDKRLKLYALDDAMGVLKVLLAGYIVRCFQYGKINRADPIFKK